jgi:hypothetical protein
MNTPSMLKPAIRTLPITRNTKTITAVGSGLLAEGTKSARTAVMEVGKDVTDHLPMNTLWQA